MGRETSLPALNERELAQPVSRGGTSAIKAPTAAANLALVTDAMKDQPNGVFSLDATGKIPGSKFPNTAGTNKVNVTGSLLVYVNTSVSFQITDYDSFRAYTVSASVGTISRTGDTINYTAPAVAQAATITVNGRQIAITIAVPAPAQPTITVPTDGATNQPTSNRTVTGSAFQALGDSSTHSSSDWQLAADTAFTNIVVQSINDAVNKTTWSPAVNLSVNTTYYLRVRYKGSNGNYGPYSATVSFTTKQYTEATVETQQIAGDYSGNISMGWSVTMSEDGTRLVCASLRTSGLNLGQYPQIRNYVFHLTGGVWTKVFSVDTDPDYPSGYGTSFITYTPKVHISPDGQRVFLQRTANGSGVMDGGGNAFIDGTVVVYTWNGSTYVSEYTFNPPNSTYQYFGAHIAMDQTASKVVISAPGQGSTGSLTPLLYYFTRTGTTWTQRQTVTTTTLRGTSTPTFSSLSMAKDGTRLIAGYAVPNTTNSTVISASVLTVGSTTMALEQNLSFTAGANAVQPGRNVAMDSTGARVAFQVESDRNSGNTTTGSVVIFSRSGTTWTQEQKLINNDVTVNENFGNAIFFNDAGDRIGIAANVKNANGITGKGSYYIFSRSGATWTRTVEVFSSLSSASENFARQFAMNKNMTAAAGWSAGTRLITFA
jgi:hypothetical protein